MIQAEGMEVLEPILKNVTDINEAKVLQAVITGGAVPDAEMAKLSEPVRNAIDKLGAEAVELGQISRESYERNRGTYLHRVYEKHELDTGAISKWADKVLSRRRQKVVGAHLKGRGLFEEVSADRILKDNAEFLGAKRGKPQKGDKIVILDLRTTTGTETLPGIEDPKGRLKKRVYWPADRPVPKRLDAYENLGTFEVRGTKGKNLVLWRDFTKAERLKMGEILDARYTIAKTFAMMADDLATGRFYRDIAQNEEWSRTEPPPEATNVDENPERGATLKRMWADLSLDWVKVPATKIPKSNAYRYGALAGRYVRADIWRDMEETHAMQSPMLWKRIMTQWKLNKTARSPVVHMNNVISNFTLMDVADVRMPDLLEGIAAMATGDNAYQEAAQAGPSAPTW